jgi:molybdopterin-biosynthesis enzyme MoeA-like protein
MPALKSAAEKIGLDVQQFETVGDPTDRLTVTIRELKASPQTNQNRIIATA